MGAYPSFHVERFCDFGENAKRKTRYAFRVPSAIESVFATVRHRTVRTNGALSQKTAKLMVFTLVRAASKKWRRLNGAIQLPKVVDGIKFTDGIALSDAAIRAA